VDEKSRQDFLKLLAKSNPRTLNTFIQVIEGKISEKDDAPFIKDVMTFLAPDLTTRQVTFLSSRLCDCGRLISQKNTLQGKCQHRGCSKYVCAECSKTCCGRTLCPRHYSEGRDGEIRCSRCRPIAWLKAFFDIGREGSEK